MASKKKGVRWSKSHDEKISALFDSGEADPYNQEVDSILEVYNNNSWIGEVYPECPTSFILSIAPKHPSTLLLKKRKALAEEVSVVFFCCSSPVDC